MDTALTQGWVRRGERNRGTQCLGPAADVDDVADAVEFLLSDKARNITGTVVTVDAGGTA